MRSLQGEPGTSRTPGVCFYQLCTNNNMHLCVFFTCNKGPTVSGISKLTFSTHLNIYRFYLVMGLKRLTDIVKENICCGDRTRKNSLELALVIYSST